MRRCLPLVASLVVAGMSGTASAATLPDWLLGDWSVEHVYQDNSKDYAPEGGPAVWWKDKSMHIGADRISFADWTCQGPHVTSGRVTVDQLLAKPAHEDTASLQMPPGKQPVPYLEISCDHSLVWSHPSAGQPGQQHDMGVAMKWRIVTTSKAEIQMPFQAWSYVVFQKAGRPSA